MGSVIKTTPDKLPGLVAARTRAFPKVLRRAAHRAAHRSRAMMVRRTPQDQGQLRNSWKVKRNMTGNELVRLILDAPHAGIVEGGARPHSVSREGWMAIYQWVTRHFGFTTTVKSGKRKGQQSKMQRSRESDFGGDLDPALEEITWGIVLRIKREGQKGTFFIKNSLPDLRDILNDEVIKQVRRISKRRKPRGAT